MMLQLRQAAVMRIRESLRLQIRVIGSACESVFHRTEELLNEDDDYADAIEFQAKKKRMEDYRDLIDFLFCEIYPKWKIRCFKFYKGEGPQLVEMTEVTEEMIDEWDDYMADMVLPTALAAYKERLECCWNGFVITVKVAERVVNTHIQY